MSSYVITGASRGIGFEFLRQLSADPAAIVIGLVRDKAATEKKVAAEIGRSNIHIFRGDLVDYESLKKAAEETSKITDGKLDYLIANGAFLTKYSAFKTFGEMADEPELLEEDLNLNLKTNVIGNIHLINLFVPLIKKGKAKKVISITSGHADIDLVNNYDVDVTGPYALGKAALNLAIAKYSAEYKKEGILFMSISPGVVDTSGHNDADGLNETEKKHLEEMGRTFAAIAPPGFRGAITPEESVRLMMDVIGKASVERGDGGSFVSQHGNKQWL
ncbi:NAD(P)-binding protein [Hypoxylon rubiginosum]|uniref:NAD(P)-binding protein n=1 Tax=Hypoxylon rubiginosum TaxID=110542 RepID=A0ACB9YMF8_9PEZI|nr:NAD(P)-binding protein [Hypoxylon rubiginosum]